METKAAETKETATTELTKWEKVVDLVHATFEEGQLAEEAN